MLRGYLAEARLDGSFRLPVFLFPGVEGRYLQVVVFAEVGDGLAASRLLGEELPDGGGGVAHGFALFGAKFWRWLGVGKMGLVGRLHTKSFESNIHKRIVGTHSW